MRVPRNVIAGWVGLWLIVTGAPVSARAAEPRTQCPICGKAGAATASYQEKASHTLARGTVNTLLGWTELLSQPATEVKDGGNLLIGIGKGVGQSVVRTLAGVGEILTFWTPKGSQGYVHFAQDCPLCMKRTSPHQP